MKKFFYILIIAFVSLAYACSDDNNEDDGYKTYSVVVELVYPENSVLKPAEGIQVTLYDTSGKAYNANTNADGKATFTLPASVYRATATDNRTTEEYTCKYTGSVSEIAVTNKWNENTITTISMTGDCESNEVDDGKTHLVIKELYVGGCQKDDGSGVFQMDKYVVLYNNSKKTATLKNLCLGMTYPHNAFATNKDIDANGKLVYEGQGWIPAGHGIWYYPQELVVAPYSEVVIALNGGIDNTKTYTNSVNLDNKAYYYTYDTKEYDNTLYYPASLTIPTEHHWKAVKYGQGNGWTLSTSSPAFYVFTTGETDPVAFANNEDNNHFHGGTNKTTDKEKKVQVEWILDGIEIFSTTSDKNQKRLTSQVDVGQTYLTNKYGYSSYRNVDKEATEKIEGNKELLVYNYNKGTANLDQGSTDPSGIDAEASIKKGAKIVYKDTNDSSKDFHQRNQASLRDK